MLLRCGSGDTHVLTAARSGAAVHREGTSLECGATESTVRHLGVDGMVDAPLFTLVDAAPVQQWRTGEILQPPRGALQTGGAVTRTRHCDWHCRPAHWTMWHLAH